MQCYPCRKFRKYISKPDLQPVHVKLPAHNGSKIPVVGKCLLTLDHKNNSFKVSFIVKVSDSVT